MALGTGALLVVALTAALAWRGDLPSGEIELFRVVNDLPDQLRDGLWLFMQLGWVGSVAVVSVLTGVLTRKWIPAVSVASAGLITWLLAKEVKDAVERARPPAYLDDVHLREGNGLGLGYPSGHAALAAAMVTVLWPYCGRTLRVVAVVLACLVALARVYFGVHLPLDVIGGAALGIAVGAAVRLVLVRQPSVEAGESA